MRVGKPDALVLAVYYVLARLPNALTKDHKPDMVALANYAHGLMMVIVPAAVLLSTEMGQRVSGIADPTLFRCQYLSAGMTLAGAVMQAGYVWSAHRAPSKIPAVRRIVDRTIKDAAMMMVMFAVLSAAYFAMAFDWQFVHRFPLAEALGSSRPVYSVRFLDWAITTPLLSLSGHGGGMTRTGEDVEAGLYASAFCIGTSCFCAWVASVTKNLPAAWCLIFFAWVAYAISTWQHLSFAWKIRHSLTAGMTKAKMLCVYVIFNLIYGIIYIVSLFGGITPKNEQTFWVFADLTAKFFWGVALIMVRLEEDQAVADLVRKAIFKQEIDMEKFVAADEAKQEQKLTKTITEAVEAVGELTYPMIVVPATTFLDQVTVARVQNLQESFKTRGVLRILESMDEVNTFKSADSCIIFFSYECLQYGMVAPNEVQLHAMKAAVLEAANMHRTGLDKLYIWLDCFCIPQKNSFLKRAAINSLYTFASLSDIMVIICPESTHASTMQPANEETVKTRFWCRMEQLAHYCKQGEQSMFLHRGARLEALPSDWMDSVCAIYNAQTTCCRIEHATMPNCDRESAVLPMLALYYDVYKRVLQSKELSPTNRAVWELIQRNKADMFPKRHVYVFEGNALPRDLFGDMIERLEVLVQKQNKMGLALVLKPQEAAHPVPAEDCKLWVARLEEGQFTKL